MQPHGGHLVDLIVPASRVRDMVTESVAYPSWTLTPRQSCDLELLATGGFSPLEGFLGRQDYESVCQSMRLGDGTLWPIPVTLGVSEAVGSQLDKAPRLALRDPEGALVAVLEVGDVWRPDRVGEAEAVFGTASRDHVGVAQFLAEEGTFYIGGRLQVLATPRYFDFPELRRTPAELRAAFAERGWDRVVAFQTRNPLHRAHFELTRRAMASASPLTPLPSGRGGPGTSSSPVVRGASSLTPQASLKLLIHPAVGMTREGDVDHYTRVRCYRAVLPRYGENQAMLSLLPIAMRMAGPREAVWHAIVRQNYGCSHFIVGRDHAGPGNDKAGKPFYAPDAAPDLATQCQGDLGIRIVPSSALVYLPETGTYVPETEVPRGQRSLNLSGTELRARLADGREIPEWFSFPEVVAELRAPVTNGKTRGVTVFFTGLSASGKSTLARALVAELESRGRAVTLLDGDIVRRHLSAGLGFTKEDRDTNIRRIGFVAAEITKHGGVAVCAAIAPYDAVRQEVRRMVEAHGHFILVYVATPIEVCEARDRKGLYAKARAGELKGFTGVSDPYEQPECVDVTTTPSENLHESVTGILRRIGG